MRKTIVLAGAAIVLCFFLGAAAQPPKPSGTTYRSKGGTVLRLMLDESNLGPEVSVGEIIFPPNLKTGRAGAKAVVGPAVPKILLWLRAPARVRPFSARGRSQPPLNVIHGNSC